MSKDLCETKKNPLKPMASEDIWSEWQGSNLRPQHPKCRALPTAPHPEIFCFLRESNSGNMREKIAQGVKLKNHAMLGFRKVPKGKKLQKSFGLLAVCRMFPFRIEFRVGFSTARRKRQRFFWIPVYYSKKMSGCQQAKRLFLTQIGCDGMNFKPFFSRKSSPVASAGLVHKGFRSDPYCFYINLRKSIFRSSTLVSFGLPGRQASA